jgi:hypothetical protein
MMKRLVRRLLGLERLSDVAKGARPEEFVEALRGTRIMLLGLWSQEGISNREMSEAVLLDEIRRNLEHLEVPEAFCPIIIQEGAERRMGIFTTDSDLQAFTREYVRGSGCSFVFQTFATTGDSLGYFLKLVDRFELNPASKDAVTFSEEHMRLIGEKSANRSVSCQR